MDLRIKIQTRWIHRAQFIALRDFLHLKQLNGKKTPQAAKIFAHFTSLKKEKIHLALNVTSVGELRS